jgi:hypothetical protein
VRFELGGDYEGNPVQRSKEEAEVIVRLDFKEKKAHICVCQWPAMAARMARQYGPSKDPHGKFSERWIVPLKAVSFRKPAVGRPSQQKHSLQGGTLPPGMRRRVGLSRATASAKPVALPGESKGINGV